MQGVDDISLDGDNLRSSFLDYASSLCVPDVPMTVPVSCMNESKNTKIPKANSSPFRNDD